MEGLTIYYGEEGSGYLLASSQGDSTFAAYERAGTNEYLGNFVVGESSGIDAVEESDGADVINVPLGSQFPSGLLVVQDGANQPQIIAQDEEELENISTNFKFVPWEEVASAFPEELAIATNGFDPRNPTRFGEGSSRTFVLRQGKGTEVITNFGGVGNGTDPSPSTMAEADTLQFVGAGLSAENLLLNQAGSDLVITFEDIQDTEVRLRDFGLEDLDNLQATGASANLGNILFNGQREIEDSFDVFDTDQQRQRIFNRDSVTFLNDLNNDVQGFGSSNDVINGQGGNDRLAGLGGDDILRGGAGDDTLTGNAGEDQFWIASGSLTEGTDTITDFEVGTDVLGIASLPGVTGISDLSIYQTGADTVIAALDQNLAILKGIEASTIDSSFAFA
ncbi:RTX toxins and related Ca2+-binding proteins [uncultured Leptolyngbya sp.]|uniref:RTX toxins and related Ca2+-binding proteins n=1 Tax=uncultured Leptolyngbya sp. TaxID=332963 RepID=A0A6J4LG93_9CYAN|nr:RTX toxins and related Ca2+-binding proteins [uncultured Leptolyngbya sp.]